MRRGLRPELIPMVPTRKADGIAARAHGEAGGQMLKDPVCGMTVSAESQHTLRQHGIPVYFCGPGCKAKFLANPSRYQILAAPLGISENQDRARGCGSELYLPHASADTSSRSGCLPICGMALEPVNPTADSGTNSELVKMRRRFWVGVPLALVVLMLAMGHEIPGLAAIATATWSYWLQFALYGPLFYGAGGYSGARGQCLDDVSRDVYPDCLRGHRRVSLQRDGDAGFAAFSPGHARSTRANRRLF